MTTRPFYVIIKVQKRKGNDTTMRTERYTNAKAIILTTEELKALEAADLVLREVQFRLGGDNTIMSLETGECSVPGDLATARGVLTFVANYRMVEVNPQ